MMKAAVQVQHSAAHPFCVRAELIDAPKPSLDGLPPGMMVVKTVATSICGSDFWGELPTEARQPGRGWRGLLPYFFGRQGCVGGSGHEVLAEVVQVSEPCGRRVGDLVLCFTTGYLLWVDSVRVPFEERTGFSAAKLPQGGSFGEFFLSYDGISIPVPRATPRPGFARALYVAAQPLGTVLHAVNRLERNAGGRPVCELRVAVVGQGQNGLLMTRVLRHLGCETVVAFDRSPERLRYARRMGATATHLVAGAGAAVPEALRCSVDVAVEMVGHNGEALDLAAAVVREDGMVLVFGLPPCEMDGGRQMRVRFGDWARNVRYVSTHAPPMETFERAMEMIRKGEFDPSLLFTHVFHFRDFPKAYEVASGYKVCAFSVFGTRRQESSKTTAITQKHRTA